LNVDFQSWLDETLKLQREGFHRDPLAMVGDELGDWFMMNFFAINTEVTEMSDECGWKPWVTDRGWINRQGLIGEAVDAMHFLANVLVTVGCTGEELSKAYEEKVQKNYARQAGGDNGVNRRCPHCKRSLDDVGTYINPGNKFYVSAELCNACGGRVK
jgi:hypothetical protein